MGAPTKSLQARAPEVEGCPDDADRFFAAPRSAPRAQPGSLSGADIEELRKPAQLEEEGILTDEEFEAQKARLLGG